MATDVIMPQMGESIAEGTVIKWMKKVGDQVERDEPLFEISTDKVDAEIPAPAAGTLSEILVEEGKTVPINTVVARLSGAGEAVAPSPASSVPEAKEAPQPSPAPAVPPPAPPPSPEPAPAAATPAQSNANAAMNEDVRQEASGVEPARGGAMPSPEPPAKQGSGEDDSESGGVSSLEERRRIKSSPLVRKIAEENDIDISRIQGSGISGRVTKNDILQFMEKPQPKPAPAAAASSPASARTPQDSPVPSLAFRSQPITLQQSGAPVPTPQPSSGQPKPSFSEGQNITIEPMSRMRKSIAEHMVLSKRTSAHVTTVFEVDFTEIDKLRRKFKESYAERGSKLTYLPFVVQAIIIALREFPVLNASIDGDNVIYRKDLNIGIAVALDWGLIVPVLKNADEKNILGLAKAINDLGERARSKKLNPDEVQGGTFTITNPGIYGGLFGTPIINQPQVAILGVGGVKKRPVVIETDEGDAIVIRSICILALTFDHRLVDGAVADQFMARVRQLIEDANFAM